MDRLEFRGVADADKFERPVSPDDGARVLKLCMHELGHYCAGRVLGARPAGITVTFWGPERFLGNCEMSITRCLATVEEIKGYLEDRVCILMAGTLGEHLSIDPVTGLVVDRGRWMREATTAYERQPSSASDRDKGDELLRVLLFMEGGAQADEAELRLRLPTISDRIWEKAIDTLGTAVPGFLTVSMMMAGKVRFYGVEAAITAGEIEECFATAA